MANVLMAPGALDAQQEEIQRRMKFAEALQNPTAEQGRMVGNHFVSFNPLAGLADILRAKIGADERKGAEQELKDLGTKRQEMMSNALKTFGQLSNPSQAGTGATNLVNDALPPEMQIGAQPQIAQRKPDMQGAYASLIESGIPSLQQMGTQGMIQLPQIAAQQQERKDAREAAHAQQMEVLKQRAEDARSTMQERLQAQREMQANQLEFQRQNAEANRAQQASMARLAASLRQPQQTQIIQTDTGPMQLVGGKAVPIVGPTGEQVKGTSQNKPLTEFQGKSTSFGTRAAQSHNILSSLEDTVSPNKVAVNNAGGALTNWAMSPEVQKISQAQRDFVNAVLRQESGAAIGSSEFANAQKQYFPQPGDTPEVINQKRQNREMVIKGFARQAGPGGEDINEVWKSGGGSNASTPAGMPSADAIAAEIARRRGGK